MTDRVEDPALRDRLTATAAMQALDVTPDPETTANRVFPEVEAEPKDELGPGDSKS